LIQSIFQKERIALLPRRADGDHDFYQRCWPPRIITNNRARPGVVACGCRAGPADAIQIVANGAPLHLKSWAWRARRPVSTP
jgi:hypothetical protein